MTNALRCAALAAAGCLLVACGDDATGTADGQDTTVDMSYVVGQQVDIDGDGNLDTAVDADGDGRVDGFDTDGDGAKDADLSGRSLGGNGGANGATDPGTGSASSTGGGNGQNASAGEGPGGGSDGNGGSTGEGDAGTEPEPGSGGMSDDDPSTPGNDGAGEVQCGADIARCDTASNACCATGLFPGLTFSCQAGASCSEGSQTVCDGPEDCGGKACCVEIPAGNVKCKDSCGFIDTQLCHEDDDCPAGKACEMGGTFKWWGVCS